MLTVITNGANRIRRRDLCRARFCTAAVGWSRCARGVADSGPHSAVGADEDEEKCVADRSESEAREAEWEFPELGALNRCPLYAVDDNEVRRAAFPRLPMTKMGPPAAAR
jgi:hypothetical protein